MNFIVKPLVCDYAVICAGDKDLICICSIKANAELIADILNGDYDSRCAYSYAKYPDAKYKVVKEGSESDADCD